MNINPEMREPVDIELIAQRILKLAEISTLEHLEAMARSQAEGLLMLANDFESTLQD